MHPLLPPMAARKRRLHCPCSLAFRISLLPSDDHTSQAHLYLYMWVHLLPSRILHILRVPNQLHLVRLLPPYHTQTPKKCHCPSPINVLLTLERRLQSGPGNQNRRTSQQAPGQPQLLSGEYRLRSLLHTVRQVWTAVHCLSPAVPRMTHLTVNRTLILL